MSLSPIKASMQNLNLNYLECFVSLSETLSFTETAKEFSVSQPSISRQIKLLEEQLNQKLFVRDKHKVHLTDAGKNLKSRMSPLIKEIKNVMDNAQESVENLKGSIHIGCLTEIGQYAFMQPVLNFHKQFPNVTFDIQFISPNQIIEKIKMGQLDFGIVGQAVDLENVRAYDILEERAVLVTRSQNHQPITDILDCKFVTYLHYDALLVHYLHNFYKRVPYGKVRKPISVNSHKAMVESLLQNDYYAVIPYFSVEKEIKEGLLQVVNQEELSNHLYLIHVENSLMSLKNQLFKKHIMKWAKERTL